MGRTYTEEQFIKTVEESTSIRQVLDRLNLVPAGGNYRSFKLLVDKLNLDISHFTREPHNKGKKSGPKRPIEDYLANKYGISSCKLKERLIKENYFDPICSSCNLDTWLGNPIPLELDHIDGNHLNNDLSNLRLLCPNCHSLTPTFRRSKTKSSEKEYIRKINHCIDCDADICPNSKRCSACHAVQQCSKSNKPSFDQLLSDLKSFSSYSSLAKHYNVSDTTVRKWCKFYGISKKA